MNCAQGKIEGNYVLITRRYKNSLSTGRIGIDVCKVVCPLHRALPTSGSSNLTNTTQGILP